MKQVHVPHCEKIPSDCCCQNVNWIWAKSCVQLESFRHGKWILYPDKADVKEIWREIKSLLGENKLGNKAKVSTSPFLDTHVICVYTNNSYIFRVLDTLRRYIRNYDYIIRYRVKIKVQGVEETTERTRQLIELENDVEDHEVSIDADVLENVPDAVNITFNFQHPLCQQPDCDQQTCIENVMWIRAKSPVQLESAHCGKWVLYSDKKDVYEHWEKIKTLLSENQLGNCAKVSTFQFLGTYLIYVYTKDFKDISDIFRVLVALRRSFQGNYVMRYCRSEKKRVKQCNKSLKLVQLFKSPSPASYNLTEESEKIEMIRKKTLIVADLRKFAGDIEATTTFYDPPKKLNLFANRRRQFCLVKINENPHQPNCGKQPIGCNCVDIPWIHEQLPGAIKSVRSGKWLIFAYQQNVNEIWEKVKMLLFSYQLGNFAKVQTANVEGRHLICVYTQDFEDIPDVFRVLLTLRRNHLQHNNLFYKTCEASRKGMYKTDETANKSYGFFSDSGQRISMYNSPPICISNNMTGDIEIIQMILNNIGPEYKRGLVAESRKKSSESEGKEQFYNPPQILNSNVPYCANRKQLTVSLLPCKYDDLIMQTVGRDMEEKFHEENCDQQPSTCCCEDVAWISAKTIDGRLSGRYTGKWLLFPDKKHVNEIWEKLKILLSANRLGTSIRVSTNNVFIDKYLILVYTNDSEDIQDVFRVLVTLRRNRLSLGYLNYKTYEATQQKIYSNEVAQMNGWDSAKELEPGRRVSMYCSPPDPTTNDPTGTNEIIQLYLNNIGPEYKSGLVAELRKNSFEPDAKIRFYNPPQTLNNKFNVKPCPLVPMKTVDLLKPVYL